MEKKGGWIFVSHSHADIETVRKIRNRFEELGYEPLLFYLKCLSDHDEIADLIRREINEREWFVYVDSENARNSDWVKSEREYIAQCEGKKLMTIDITGDVIAQTESIARSLKVFISASARDRDAAKRLGEAFADRDYLVLSGDTLAPGESFLSQIGEQVEDASREGFVLVLIGEESAGSPLIAEEVRRAKACGGKLIPIYLEGATLPDSLMPLLGDLPGAHISRTPTEAELDALFRLIEGRIRYYASDFKQSHGFRGARRITYPHVASIPSHTFVACDVLEQVTIPRCVTYISDTAFAEGQDVLIVSEKGSYAEAYARRHGMRWQEG